MVTDSQAVEHNPTRRARRLVMLIDGVFLAAVGAAQVTFELVGYFAGRRVGCRTHGVSADRSRERRPRFTCAPTGSGC
jgi:hypothetical protein